MTSPARPFPKSVREAPHSGPARLDISPTSRRRDDEIVEITRGEYRRLVETSRQYANLRRNLLKSGKVDERAVDLLSKDVDGDGEHFGSGPRWSQSFPRRDSNDDNGGAALHGNESPASYGQSWKSNNWRPSGSTNGTSRTFTARSPEEDWSDSEVAVYDGDTYQLHTEDAQQDSRREYERQCMRTLNLTNLPDGTTHADITAVVRGGILLDIFVRTQDRTAAVSFLHADDAKTFFEHVKRHDLYIKSKRVEVKWHDRQYTLGGHIANKIGIGATRNLVIRRCDPRITEDIIREDMDHIHNLVIIKVEFVGTSCHIRTNSVNNSMFARTCMMSRLLYKGSKIEWDVDECAQPYDPRPIVKHKVNPQSKRPSSSAVNRFQLLNLDDNDEE